MIWVVLIALALLLLLGVVIATHSDPPADDFDSDHGERERVGYLSEYAAERDQRVARALARHDERRAA